MTVPRVLVTGSRNWPSPDRVRRGLLDLAAEMGVPSLQLIHGGAKGADTHAHAVAVAEGWPEPEVHLPDYPAFGRHRAPLLRDEQMVRADIDECLAFLARCDRKGCPSRGLHGSHGTFHTGTYAEDWGVHTTWYLDPPDAVLRPEPRPRR